MLAFMFMFSVMEHVFIYNWQESPSSNVVGLVILVKKKRAVRSRALSLLMNQIGKEWLLIMLDLLPAHASTLRPDLLG